MRRLLNRARRIELQATTKDKERPALISGWDTDPYGKSVEKYWYFETAELNEHNSLTEDMPEQAFQYREELELHSE